jgi:FkbM family methyltransferase
MKDALSGLPSRISRLMGHLALERVKLILRGLFPMHYSRMRFRVLESNSDEPEMQLLPLLVDPYRLAIDVGAAGGVYSVRLLSLASRVIAFEPRIRAAAELEELARILSLNLEVHCVALSESPGVATLRALEQDPYRSTISDSNSLSDADGGTCVQQVQVVTSLDSLDLEGVGFLKIDVEGAEFHVLVGARQLISRERFPILVECEERHSLGAVERVRQLMFELGYRGYFLENARLRGVENFDLDTHQIITNIGGWKTHSKRAGLYVNNFVYVPIEVAEKFESAVEESFSTRNPP